MAVLLRPSSFGTFFLQKSFVLMTGPLPPPPNGTAIRKKEEEKMRLPEPWIQILKLLKAVFGYVRFREVLDKSWC